MKKAKIFDIDCKHCSYGVVDNFNRKIKRISRWIKIEDKYVTKNHSLYDYADRYCEEQGKAPVSFFRHDNRLYALGQFMRLLAPYAFIDTDGEKSFVSGYDCTNWYNPLLIEIHDSGEYVRLYQELTELEYDKLMEEVKTWEK